MHISCLGIRHRAGHIVRGAAALAIAATAGVAQAQDTDAVAYAPVAPFRSIEPYLDVHGSASYTDNAFRSVTDKQSDTTAAVGVSLDIKHDGRKFDANAQGNLDWVKYLNNSFGSKALGYFDGRAIWGESTDWIQWSVAETFGQLLTDALAAPTPDSLENINYFTTGPTFNVPLGTLAQLSLYGLYSRTSYENSNLNSHEYLGGATLGRQLSSSSRLSLNATSQHTKFDDDITNTNYDVRQYFLSYEGTGPRTTLTLEGGYTKLIRTGHEGQGTLLRAELARRISPSSSVYFRAGQDYSTAGQALRATTFAGSSATAGAPLASTEPFKERTYEGGYRYARGRTNVSLLVNRIRDVYLEHDNLTHTITSYVAYFERRLGPTLTVSLRGSYGKSQYPALGDFDETQYSAELSKSFSHLVLSTQYGRFARKSLGTLDYQENRVGLRASYSFNVRP